MAGSEEKGMSTDAEEMAARRPRRGGKVLWIALGAIVIAGVIIGAGVLLGWIGGSSGVSLVGGGATFPYPLIAKWSSVYVNLTCPTTCVRVNYQAIGSGGGVSQIIAKTLDFAGTDAPLNATERSMAPGILHIPETIGAVTAAYNLPGIPSGLNLTGQILADIYLGTITMWNNASIAALNPGLSLPNTAISVIHRSDGSGTTFVWTSYLHLASTTWPSSLVGKNPTWPTGIGKPGNNGVAGYVKQNPNTIGYAELAYTVQNSMTVAKVQNPAGNFILPTLNSTKAAAEGATPVLPAPDGDWSSVSILNAAGANSYPISTLTYLLVYKELNVLGSSMTQPKAKALVDFLWWVVHDGQTYSAALVYVPLPSSIVTLDEGDAGSARAGIRTITYNGQTLHT